MQVSNQDDRPEGMPDGSRRLGRLKITGHMIGAVCRDGTPRTEVVRNPMPEDARLVEAHSTPWNELVCIFESASFPWVAPGMAIPDVPSPQFRAVVSEFQALGKACDARS